MSCPLNDFVLAGLITSFLSLVRSTLHYSCGAVLSRVATCWLGRIFWRTLFGMAVGFRYFRWFQYWGVAVWQLRFCVRLHGPLRLFWAVRGAYAPAFLLRDGLGPAWHTLSLATQVCLFPSASFRAVTRFVGCTRTRRIPLPSAGTAPGPTSLLPGEGRVRFAVSLRLLGLSWWSSGGPSRGPTCVPSGSGAATWTMRFWST